MKKHFYVDVDDVLSETARELCGLSQRLFGKSCTYEEMYTFNLQDSFHLTAEEIVHLMEVAHEDEFMLSLPVVPGAREGVERLLAAGCRVSIVTGRPLKTARASMEWLRKNGFPVLPFFCFDKYGRWEMGSAQDPHLLTRAAFDATDFDAFVDDSPTALEILKTRARAEIFVFNRPWNQSYAPAPNMRRVDGWSEIRF